MEPKETNEKRKGINCSVPVMLLLALISIIAMLLTSIIATNDSTQKIANVNEKTILGETETISESVGDNVTGTFDSSTGEIKISSTEGQTGTIDKTQFRELIGKCTGYTTITFENEVYAPQDSSGLFFRTLLTNINNVNNLNTSHVTNMENMFSNCRYLTSLDLSNWDTTNVTDMGGMFYYCDNLTTLNVSTWNTENVQDMNQMFAHCSNLTSLDLTNWNTEHVTNMDDMFSNASNLQSVGNLDNWNVEHVTNMGNMFNGCKNLSTLQLKNWNLSAVTTMITMFNGCSALETIDVSNWQLGQGINNMMVMFNGCSNLKSLDMSSWDMSGVTTTMMMLGGCTSLTDIYTPKVYSSTQTISLPSSYYCLDADPESGYTGESTKVGEHVSGTFDEEAGEIKIASTFNTFSSLANGTFEGSVHLSKEKSETIGTINKSEFTTFISRCVGAETITFENEVYAPVDSTGLFSQMKTVTSINNANNLNTSNVTMMNTMFDNSNALSTIDISLWNTENVINMVGMFKDCSNLTTIGNIGNWNTENVQDMLEMFEGCSNLTTIDLSNWNTGKVTNMLRMFEGCSNLTTIDLSNWNTEKVTSMLQMFEKCSRLTTIGNISNWNTQSLTEITMIFNECTSLTELDLSNWNVSNVENMIQAFCNCSNLETLNISNWQIENANMAAILKDCSSLKQLDIRNWDMSNIVNTKDMLIGCTSLTDIYTPKICSSTQSIPLPSSYYCLDADPESGYIGESTKVGEHVSGTFDEEAGEIKIASTFNTFSSLANGTFEGSVHLSKEKSETIGTIDKESFKNFISGCTGYKTITFENEVYAPQDSNALFSYVMDIKNIDNLNTSKVTNMKSMFTNCSYLTSLDLSNWDIRNVTDMTSMFYYCTNLTTLNVSNWDTGSVQSMNLMFGYCSSLTSLDLTNWNTEHVTNMENMFVNASNLQSVGNLNDWNVEQVNSMSMMFNGCKKLSTLQLKNWNVSAVTNMLAMFTGCSALETIDVSNWQLGQDTNMTAMFNGCSSLKQLDIKNWDMSSVTYTTAMLQGCTSLTDIYTPKAYSTQTVNLPSDDWYNVDNINDNNVYSSFTDTTFEGSTHLSKLVNYDISYELGDGNLSEENPNTYNAVSNFTLNNPEKEGYVFTGWTGSNGETKSKSVSINGREVTGDLEYTANYEIEKHTLTIDPNKGIWESKSENSTFELAHGDTKKIENPTRVGYTFDDWSISGAGSTIDDTNFTMGSEDTTLTANWVANEATPYVVKHWQQKLNGIASSYDDENYELIDTEEKTGRTDETITPDLKTYDGFISPESKTVTISADGSTVVDYYYKRRTDLSYTVKYIDNDTKIEIETPKTVNNQTFGSEIIASEEVIPIDEYIYHSVSTDTLLITTGQNILNIYYTKKETSVIVHHYIYDTEQGNTTIRLTEDVEIEGKVGQQYITEKSNNIPSNYRCVNEQPEGYTGNMTENVIEVNYYYELITPTIENNTEVTAIVGDKEEETVVLRKENGEITYNIKYTATIKDYIGNAKIKIVDTLPEGIDTDKSELAEGIYNSSAHTITWIEEIEGIDTFERANATGKNVGSNITRIEGDKCIIQITKQITIVYDDQDVTQDLVNTVKSEALTYYPQGYLTKGGQEFAKQENTDSVTVKQEYKANLKGTIVWDDNENAKEKRPDNVTVEIRVMPKDELIATTTLSEENDWTYEQKGLDKYNSDGEKIIYTITQLETQDGDLEYYESPVIMNAETQTEEATNYLFTITNSYRLMKTNLNTQIDVTKTEEITNKQDKVNYTIKLTSEIQDYIGSGKVKIVSTLPYRIDLEKSDISKGIYDNENKTITWTEEIAHINTSTGENRNNSNVGTMIENPNSNVGESSARPNGKIFAINITKKIKLVYKDIDLAQEKMTSKFEGSVELYDTEIKDEKTVNVNTDINVQGKIKVRYVDIDTGKDIVGESSARPNGGTYNYEITGKIGSTYQTEKKEIEGYTYKESTGNETGKIKEKDQEVVYYYEKIQSAKLTVKYVDIDTNEDIVIYEQASENIVGESSARPNGTYTYEITGKIGDDYETEQKEIPYYIYVKDSGNIKGKLEEETIVIYYYRKMSFNFSIEKTISSITVNGEKLKISNGKATKVEVKTKEVQSTDIVVKYNIKVTNKGELKGKANISEILPKGFELVKVSDEWNKKEDGTLESEIELEPEESKNLSIELKWTNNEENLGSKVNIAKILNTNNIAGYDDNNKEDDISNATIVVSIKTGWQVSTIIIITFIISMIITGYLTTIIIHTFGKGPDIKDIKFLMKK